MAKELSAAVKGADAKLSAPEQKAYSAMLRTLAAKKVTSKTLARRLSGIRVTTAAASAPVGTALTLLDFDSDAILADNQINGIVSVGGVPRGKPFTDDERKKLGEILKRGAVEFTDSRGRLHLRGNVLVRFAGGQDSLAAIRKVMADDKGSLAVWASAQFTDNIIAQGGNCFVAQHFSLNATRFLEVKEDLGVAVTRSATYVGNIADNDVRLFSVSSSSPALAANQGLNIVA
jgi:hypothetical protein